MTIYGAITYTGFDDAIIGYAKRWYGETHATAIYDIELMADVLVNRDGMTREEADEYIEFNILGGYIGEDAPLIIIRKHGDDTQP